MVVDDRYVELVVAVVLAVVVPRTSSEVAVSDVYYPPHVSRLVLDMSYYWSCLGTKDILYM